MGGVKGEGAAAPRWTRCLRDAAVETGEGVGVGGVGWMGGVGGWVRVGDHCSSVDQRPPVCVAAPTGAIGWVGGCSWTLVHMLPALEGKRTTAIQ